MDIKSILKYVKIEKHSRVFDLGIAVYLLNPLKSEYTYDDIAKEYLNGMILPSREELLGKMSMKKPGRTVQKDWDPLRAFRHILRWQPGNLCRRL